jgi:hypothetical protein
LGADPGVTSTTEVAHNVPKWMVRVRRGAERLRRATWSDRLTAVRVGALLVLAEAAVRLFALPRVARWFGAPLCTGPTGPAAAGAAPGPADLRRLRIARRVADNWPFGTGPCLRASLVEGHLLRRFNPVLRVGADRQEGRFVAHAWLEVGGLRLDGSTIPAFESSPT